VGIAAGAILLLEGLQHLNKWQESWILYRATCEGLRHEQHLFFEKAGPYADLKPDIAQRLLAERVGAPVLAEHSKWVYARTTRPRRRWCKPLQSPLQKTIRIDVDCETEVTFGFRHRAEP